MLLLLLLCCCSAAAATDADAATNSAAAPVDVVLALVKFLELVVVVARVAHARGRSVGTASAPMFTASVTSIRMCDHRAAGRGVADQGIRNGRARSDVAEPEDHVPVVVQRLTRKGAPRLFLASGVASPPPHQRPPRPPAPALGEVTFADGAPLDALLSPCGNRRLWSGVWQRDTAGRIRSNTTMLFAVIRRGLAPFKENVVVIVSFLFASVFIHAC